MEEPFIKNLSIDDLKAYVEFKNILSLEDTYVAQSGEITTLEEEKDSFAEFLKEVAEHNAVEITLRNNDRMIGYAKIWRMNNFKRNYHVGCLSIALLKDYRGQGYGKKLMIDVIKKAKEEIEGLKIITLTTYSNNTIAINLYNKLEFKEWGRLPKAVLFKGDFVDQVEMFLEV